MDIDSDVMADTGTADLDLDAIPDEIEDEYEDDDEDFGPDEDDPTQR